MVAKAMSVFAIVKVWESCKGLERVAEKVVGGVVEHTGAGVLTINAPPVVFDNVMESMPRLYPPSGKVSIKTRFFKEETLFKFFSVKYGVCGLKTVLG